MSESKADILAAIAYFDIFNYPLTAREIFLFLRHAHSYKTFEDSLRELVREKVLYAFEEFYSLQNNIGLLQRRVDGNRSARKLIKTAKKVASVLALFPYVRGIAISGSLSKNYADEGSDIDLFIITAENRLWIARTLMHCLKKVAFLFEKQHWFCMNYYIDEHALTIVEKNVYTAIEIATLMPLQGEDSFEKFYAANAWFRRYLPNNFLRVSSAEKIRRPFLKRLFEWIFNNRLGDMLDRKLMEITDRRWTKKTEQKQLSSSGMIMSMHVSRHIAKPEPGNFQVKLIRTYEEKIKLCLEKFDADYSVH